MLAEAFHFDWRKGWIALGRLDRIASGWVAVPAKTTSRPVRYYLPRVAFYATVVVLSFAIGAWIAIYLQ